MVNKISSNKYIPDYLLCDLPWHERDGLLTYIDRVKYEHFVENRDLCMQKVEVVNFSMIYNKFHSDPLLNAEAFNKTIKKKDLKIFSKQVKKKYSVCCSTF